MIPWFWLWCPQFHWPLSGTVRQGFSPALFFDAIPARAGDGAIEGAAFQNVASYGRQLGVLSEVVLSLAAPGDITKDDAQHAIAQLRDIRARIDTLKSQQREADYEAAQAALERLARRDKAALGELLGRFAPPGGPAPPERAMP